MTVKFSSFATCFLIPTSISNSVVYLPTYLYRGKISWSYSKESMLHKKKAAHVFKGTGSDMTPQLWTYLKCRDIKSRCLLRVNKLRDRTSCSCELFKVWANFKDQLHCKVDSNRYPIHYFSTESNNNRKIIQKRNLAATT